MGCYALTVSAERRFNFVPPIVPLRTVPRGPRTSVKSSAPSSMAPTSRGNSTSGSRITEVRSNVKVVFATAGNVLQNPPPSPPPPPHPRWGQFGETTFILNGTLVSPTAENACELNCIPRGENFFYRHRSAVVDGTSCHPGRRDVCVGGVCKVGRSPHTNTRTWAQSK